MPRLDGNSHVNLTVSDLERSVPWYCRVFGFVEVNDVSPEGSGFRFVTLVHPTSLASVVLGQAADGGAGRFDERRAGLHHLAYHVPERGDLDEWVAHLDRLGVEHSGVLVGEHEAGLQVWIRDPDGIWLEVYWLNRRFFAERLRQRWRSGHRFVQRG